MNHKRLAATAVAVGLMTVGMGGTAQASESRSGYRECAGRIVVNSQTAALNGSFYVYHYVTYTGVRYTSTRWTTAGFHSFKFSVPGGGWQAYTSNGTMSQGYATCG